MVYPPAHGARELGNGWYMAEKIGYFYAESFPWFLHPYYGWWCAAQSNKTNLAVTSSDWYWDNQLQWL